QVFSRRLHASFDSRIVIGAFGKPLADDSACMTGRRSMLEVARSRSLWRAAMRDEINVSTIVDAVYQTVFDLTADIHQARWDAYWTLTTLLYSEMELAA